MRKDESLYRELVAHLLWKTNKIKIKQFRVWSLIWYGARITKFVKFVSWGELHSDLHKSLNKHLWNTYSPVNCTRYGNKIIGKKRDISSAPLSLTLQPSPPPATHSFSTCQWSLRHSSAFDTQLPNTHLHTHTCTHSLWTTLRMSS